MKDTILAEDVLTVLSTLEIDGNDVRIAGQIDRKLYLAVNKVLERIGGKWNRKAHVFDVDPTDRIEAVMESGVLDPKVKTGYFPTPPKIVDRMIGLAGLERNHLILEPSAGQGHIADGIRGALKHVTTAFGLLAPGGALVAIMGAGVTFRENRKTTEFRETVMEPHGTYIERLPAGTFKESGTMVNTILLRLER